MKVLLIFCSVFALLSCGNSKNNSKNVDKEANVIKATIGEINQKSDPVEINSVEIKENIMTLTVSYSGGCGEHDFQLVGSPFVMKSLPGKRPVSLIHNANGDLCEAYLTKELQFNISELAISQDKGSEIFLILNDKEYLYQYK